MIASVDGTNTTDAGELGVGGGPKWENATRQGGGVILHSPAAKTMLASILSAK